MERLMHWIGFQMVLSGLPMLQDELYLSISFQKWAIWTRNPAWLSISKHTCSLWTGGSLIKVFQLMWLYVIVLLNCYCMSVLLPLSKLKKVVTGMFIYWNLKSANKGLEIFFCWHIVIVDLIFYSSRMVISIWTSCTVGSSFASCGKFKPAKVKIGNVPWRPDFFT